MQVFTKSILLVLLTAFFLPSCELYVESEDDNGSDSDSDTDTDSDMDGGAAVWRPTPGTTWQWQLSGTLNTSYDVEMYDIDLIDNTAATVAQLQNDGRIVVCYFSAGSYEDWRDDMSDWDTGSDPWIGDPLDEWPGERWLDVTSPEVRALMKARLDLARTKGCDGVEPDNVDGYANDNGVGLTAADQLVYNKFLAAEAHTRGLSIGLKNDLDQVSELLSHFDWALNEECFEWNECEALAPFVNAGKAVFHTEYSGNLAEICSHPSTTGFSTIKKNYDLDAHVELCP
jgi:hypothetical protein